MQIAIPRLAAVLAVCISIPACFGGGETWADPLNPARPLRATLSGIYGPLVVLTTSNNRTRMLELSSMTGEDAVRAAAFLERQTAHSSLEQPMGRFSQELRGELVRLHNKKFEPVKDSAVPEPLFYVLYFSAGWCGPCHRFTPWLVESYLKQKTPTATDFEVIFVSSDESRGSMIEYMEEMKMPWPAVKFESRRAETFQRYAGNGIPCIAVVDRNGTLIFHSYVNGKYHGADEPWERFLEFREIARTDSPAAQLARFRLTCNSRPARFSNEIAPAEVYFATPLNPQPFQEAGITTFTITVVVDHDSTVLSATAGGIPVGPADYAESSARHWLFLPKVDHGKNVRSSLAIPIQIPPTNPPTAAPQ